MPKYIYILHWNSLEKISLICFVKSWKDGKLSSVIEGLKVKKNVTFSYISNLVIFKGFLEKAKIFHFFQPYSKLFVEFFSKNSDVIKN